MKNRQQRRQKPSGATYADILAQQRRNKEACEEAARSVMVKVMSDIQVQKMNWLFMVSLNDAFEGRFGKVAYERLAKAIEARSNWFEEIADTDGADVAEEKLKREAQRVTRQELSFAWEEEIAIAKEIHAHEKRTRFERLRMDAEKLAVFLCDTYSCDRCPGRALCSHKGAKANGLIAWLREEGDL